MINKKEILIQEDIASTIDKIEDGIKSLENTIWKNILSTLSEKEGIPYIKELRDYIDVIDKMILGLFGYTKKYTEVNWPLLFNEEVDKLMVERTKLTKKIGMIKKKINMPVYQPDRFREIIEKLYQYNLQKEYWFTKEQIHSLWKNIHEESCKGQENLK